MGRRGRAKVRKIDPDPVYNQVSVAKLINRVMKDGKKQTAANKVYKAFEIIKKKTKKEPFEVFQRAIDNIRPKMEVRSRRVGGAAYQVPSLVRGARAESLALRWLVNFARERPNKEYHTFEEKLAVEIIDAHNREGGAMTRRGEIEKIAEANRVFSHLGW